jgi:phosphoglycerol transferase MdoB-like AlkP superfamily enzyme
MNSSTFKEYITNNKFLPIVKVYCLGVISFFIFRLIFVALNLHELPADSVGLLMAAFVMGFRFDTVICSYLLFASSFLVFINLFFKSRLLNTLNNAYLRTMFLLTFFFCAVDLPYYIFHSSRLSKTAFGWFFSSPEFVLKMIFSEPKFWLVGMAPLVLVSLFFLWGFKQWVEQSKVSSSPRMQWLIFIPLALLLVVGARGRLGHKSPIRTGTAYFSNNQFINILGLNPVFTLLNSLKSKEQAALIEPKFALSIMRSELRANENSKGVERNIVFNEPRANYNVVLVMMESMSAKKTGIPGGKNLTPQLDRLAKESISFENAYTLGIHTFNGVFSTLFALPTAYGEHPMKVFPMPKLEGLATSLKRHGYSTHFFIPHDAEFDNMAGFLTHNSFDLIHAESKYPSEKVLSTLGVPDHVMFDYSLGQLSDRNGPFLAVYLTASDHGPYVVPDDIPFKPNSTDAKERATQYADWAIGKFVNDARAMPWFDNTLFVFIADHGSPIETKYDISLNYHHTPLLFFMPQNLKPESRRDLASQLDVYPSIMGLLKAPYTNESLGVDVFSQARKFVPLSSGGVLGLLDHEYLYIYRQDGDSLYNYHTKKLDDYSDALPELAQQMRQYVLSLFQSGREIPKLKLPATDH